MAPPGRRRPLAGNQEPQVVVAGRQGDNGIVPPLPDSVPLFDVRVAVDAYSKTTTYVPAVEMDHALQTAGEFWQATARSAIRALAQTRSTFTIDDLRRDGLVPDPVNVNAWGAALSAAAKAGDITHVGYRKSHRRAAHSRIVSVWTRAK